MMKLSPFMSEIGGFGVLQGMQDEDRTENYNTESGFSNLALVEVPATLDQS